MKLATLLSGNELMTGDIVDSNSAMIAQHLLPLGVSIREKVTVGDNLQQLTDEITRLSSSFDVLLVNGGLGPTVDDLTAQALADAMEVSITRNPEAERHLVSWCEGRGLAVNKSNLKQAMLPEGIAIIPNKTGSAVGFKTELNNCRIFCTPGVPSELRHMLEEQIVPELAQQIPADARINIKKMKVLGIGESSLQEMLNEEFPDWPAALELGFRAGRPLLELKIQSRVEDAELQHEWFAKLKTLCADYYVGDGDHSMAYFLVQLLAKSGKTICTAESCTGGLIASELTSVAGASKVFEAGFVTYSNSMKTEMLGVSPDTLAQHGAVSEATVREMLEGALARSKADYGVAVSGIAGPEGGSDDKPVGTVWIAWGSADSIQARNIFFPSSREFFQTMIASFAMDLIRRALLGLNPDPRYFRGTPKR